MVVTYSKKYLIPHRITGYCYYTTVLLRYIWTSRFPRLYWYYECSSYFPPFSSIEYQGRNFKPGWMWTQLPYLLYCTNVPWLSERRNLLELHWYCMLLFSPIVIVKSWRFFKTARQQDNAVTCSFWASKPTYLVNSCLNYNHNYFFAIKY